MKVLLTAFVTIVAGGLSFSLGQVVVRGMVEPSLELKRTIGRIAHDLEMYANKIFDADARPEFVITFRGYSAHLREHLSTIIWYSLFEGVFRLPPRKDVARAAMLLRGHSNAPLQPQPGTWHDKSEEIRQLLRITE